MPSTSLNEVTMGIEAPEPISTAGLPHSSASAAAAACMKAVLVSKEMAVPACLLENSAVQSARQARAHEFLDVGDQRVRDPGRRRGGR